VPRWVAQRFYTKVVLSSVVSIIIMKQARSKLLVWCRISLLFAGMGGVLVAQQRPFYMGCTPWPPDLTNDAVRRVYSFIRNNADLIAFHFDGGVPWPEALEGKEFSQHLRNDWEFRRSQVGPNQAVYVAITPMNFDRNALAPYWGKSDNRPLPKAWRKYGFNHPNVKEAFLAYARRVIEHFRPDFLAIGIEVNILLSKAPGKWNDYLELNRYVYEALKSEYPDLYVFATVQYEHLRGIEEESKANLKLQAPGVAELMKYSDLLALSTYRYGLDHNRLGEDYFQTALQFGRPLAISECGAMSEGVEIFGRRLRATPKDQADFIELILRKAQELKFLFVINWLAIDYDKMLGKLPKPAREVAKAWVHTGMVTADGQEKPALAVWRRYLQMKRTSGAPKPLPAASSGPAIEGSTSTPVPETRSARARARRGALPPRRSASSSPSQEPLATIFPARAYDFNPDAPSGQADIRVWVDDVVWIRLRGDVLHYEVISGRPPGDDGTVLTQPLPNEHLSGFHWEVLEGRGRVQLVAPPGPENEYTAEFKINDNKKGAARYHLRITWRR